MAVTVPAFAAALRSSCENRMKGYETPIHAADVIRILDAYEAGLHEIAKGDTPAELHGHFMAHRAAVQLARQLVGTPSPPTRSPSDG